MYENKKENPPYTNTVGYNYILLLFNYLWFDSTELWNKIILPKNCMALLQVM